MDLLDPFLFVDNVAAGINIGNENPTPIGKMVTNTDTHVIYTVVISKQNHRHIKKIYIINAFQNFQL